MNANRRMNQSDLSKIRKWIDAGLPPSVIAEHVPWSTRTIQRVARGGGHYQARLIADRVEALLGGASSDSSGKRDACEFDGMGNRLSSSAERIDDFDPEAACLWIEEALVQTAIIEDPVERARVAREMVAFLKDNPDLGKVPFARW